MLALAFCWAAAGPALADTESRIKRLEEIILEQQRKLSEQEQRIKELEARPSAPEAQLQPQPPARAAAARSALPPRAPTAAPESVFTVQPFLVTTKAMFEAVTDGGLDAQRGGLVPVYNVQLPDGRNMLVPAASIGQLLAQAPPRDPTFEVEPERKEPPPPPRRAAPRRPPAPVARPVQRRAPPQPPAPAPAPAPATDEERAKSQKAQDQALLERGAILLRPGALQVEPGIEYSRFGSNAVQISGVTIFDAIIIGTIRVDAAERDVLTGTLRLRAGVINRVQVDATVPYVHRRDTEILGVGTANVTQRVISAHGIGDVEFGISGQPLIGRGWIPNILVRGSMRFPTGTNAFEIPTELVPGTVSTRRPVRPATGSGFFAVSGTVTAVLPIDPVVLFLGGGYTVSIPREFTGFGRISPGDQFQFFAGLNFALNERVSFNFSFVNQRAYSTKRDGETLLNTQATDARVVLGTSVGITSNINVVMNAGIGLTSQAPNFTFFVAVPVTFQLF